MGKAFWIILTLFMVFQLAACGAGTQASNRDIGPFPGKIVIITSMPDQSKAEYYSGERMVSKYGADKILHMAWPENFMEEQTQMINIMAEIAADKDVKALIINQAVLGTNRAVDKLLETRKDIFIVYCDPSENVHEITARADLILAPNHLAEGTALVSQAKSQGAKTFVHYSFPRHMAMFMLAERRDLIREACDEMGLEFVDAPSPDPMGNTGLEGAQKFIREDSAKKLVLYGKDTALFSTNCGMQVPLITSVVENGGIFPRPCCASPYHGFPEALGITISGEYNDMAFVIDETRRITAEKGMTGRMSTWPVPVSIMFTVTGTEYAIKWIRGEVHDEVIDMDMYYKLSYDYIREFTDSDIGINVEPYVENGIAYDSVLLLLVGYLNY